MIRGLDNLAFYAGNLTEAQIIALAGGAISTAVAPPASLKAFQLHIATNADSTELQFSWVSRNGLNYDLPSTSTLSGALENWLPVRSGIAATAPLNTLSIPCPAAPNTFYVLRETPAAAEPCPAGRESTKA